MVPETIPNIRSPGSPSWKSTSPATSLRGSRLRASASMVWSSGVLDMMVLNRMKKNAGRSRSQGRVTTTKVHGSGQLRSDQAGSKVRRNGFTVMVSRRRLCGQQADAHRGRRGNRRPQLQGSRHKAERAHPHCVNAGVKKTSRHPHREHIAMICSAPLCARGVCYGDDVPSCSNASRARPWTCQGNGAANGTERGTPPAQRGVVQSSNQPRRISQKACRDATIAISNRVMA